MSEPLEFGVSAAAGPAVAAAPAWAAWERSGDWGLAWACPGSPADGPVVLGSDRAPSAGVEAD